MDYFENIVIPFNGTMFVFEWKYDDIKENINTLK